jgi:Ca2+:H+ antiporter
MLNWLLIFVPITIGLDFLMPGQHTLIFLASCLAVIPLAGRLGHATAELARYTGEGAGGLLNATFGNAAELIIAIMAIRKGLYSVVKASLTGSIIGNILLVLGAAILAGGLKHKHQRFNMTGARAQATLLTLAAIALVMPAAFHALAGPQARVGDGSISLGISFVLLIAYGLHLLFSLRTHKQLFAGETQEEAPAGAWSLRRALLTLAGTTVLIAWISEILVGSVQEAASAFGMTNVFIGVIVVAVVGNAAEHSSAVMLALNNRMELAMGIAVGSSLQIALFVAPLLVIVSRFLGPRPMDLMFTPAEVLAIFLAVLITGQIASDGESNWIEGVQLLAVYTIMAIVFYFLPQ